MFNQNKYAIDLYRKSLCSYINYAYMYVCFSSISTKYQERKQNTKIVTNSFMNSFIECTISLTLKTRNIEESN